MRLQLMETEQIEARKTRGAKWYRGQLNNLRSQERGRPRGSKSTGKNTDDQQHPHPCGFVGTLELFAFCP